MALESSPSMCQKLKIPKSKEKLFNFIQNEKYRHQENIETYSITWFSQQQQKSLASRSNQSLSSAAGQFHFGWTYFYGSWKIGSHLDKFLQELHIMLSCCRVSLCRPQNTFWIALPLTPKHNIFVMPCILNTSGWTIGVTKPQTTPMRVGRGGYKGKM